MIYVYPDRKDHIITHDGKTELGRYNTTLREFIPLLKEPFTVVYWKPKIMQ